MGAQGSAVSGGAASIGSELSAALGYSTQQSGLSEKIFQGRQRGLDLQSEINTLYGKAGVLQAQANVASAKAGMYSSQAASYMGIAGTALNIGTSMFTTGISPGGYFNIA